MDSRCWQQLLNLISTGDVEFSTDQWPQLQQHLHWHNLTFNLLLGSQQHSRLNSQQHGQTKRPIATCFSELQLNELKIQAMTVRADNLLKLELQKQISSHLQHGGIHHLFFKGLTLSNWLYGHYSERQCRDIDLIVHPEQHQKAMRVLSENGFQQFMPRPNMSEFSLRRYRNAMKDMCLREPKSGALIELHWQLREHQGAFDFDFDHAYEHRKLECIDGAELPCFDDVTHLRYIAMHGCLSHWGRLRWVLDWHKAATRLDSDTLKKAYELSKTKNEQRYIELAFQIAHAQIGTEIPEYISTASSRQDRYWLKTTQKMQAANRYPPWLITKFLTAIVFNSPRKTCGYTAAFIRKAMAADLL